MLVVAVVGVAVAVEWDAGAAGVVGKADACGKTLKYVWAIRRQHDQDLWCRRQAAIPHPWRASMKKRVRLAGLARRSARPRRLLSVRLP